jgi:hypothetical protein
MGFFSIKIRTISGHRFWSSIKNIWSPDWGKAGKRFVQPWFRAGHPKKTRRESQNYTAPVIIGLMLETPNLEIQQERKVLKQWNFRGYGIPSMFGCPIHFAGGSTAVQVPFGSSSTAREQPRGSQEISVIRCFPPKNCAGKWGEMAVPSDFGATKIDCRSATFGDGIPGIPGIGWERTCYTAN